MSQSNLPAEEKYSEDKACFKASDKDTSYVEDGSSSHAEFIACAKEAVDDESFMRNRNGAKRLVLSTTSSVYAEHTISNPDNDQVKYCIAAILQAQIFDDSMNEELTNHEDSAKFELDIKLPPEYGGEVDHIPEDILNHETLNDLELRSKLISGEVPTVDTMYRFISMMISLAEYSVECNILALIYINRMTGRNKMALTMRNWRGLWVASIIIAQKVWDDQPLKTSSFVRILPNTTKEQLKNIEMSGFTMLDFNTTVRPSVYAKYYFELRQLFKEIVGNNPRYNWRMEPMTIAEAKRLEYRTALPGVSSRAHSNSSHASHKPSASQAALFPGPSGTNTPSYTPMGKSRTLDEVDVKSVSRRVLKQSSLTILAFY